jgi:hypothetical protein
VPVTFCKALLEFTAVTTNDSSSLRKQGPITTAGSNSSGYQQQALCDAIAAAAYGSLLSQGRPLLSCRA